MGLKIDVLFPNPDIPLPKILGNIASRGVLFAIVITPLNEEHNSMTVNILQVRIGFFSENCFKKIEVEVILEVCI